MAVESIYGLVGYPARHSFSALMHNAAFLACGISAEYRLFEIKPQDLSAFLLTPAREVVDTLGVASRAGDILGFNITIPHKVAAYEVVAKAFPSASLRSRAERISVDVPGAINTIKRGNKLDYYNTDVAGFARSLREWGVDSASSVTLLGCGGAGRAVVAALLGWEFSCHKVYIYEKMPQCVAQAGKHFKHFPELDSRCEFIPPESLPTALEKSALLVNATGLGMHEGDPSPLDKKIIHKRLRVYDLVYNRPTQLLVDARKQGCPVCDGLTMLLYQGVEAWEIWTGRTAPVEVMRQALTQKIRQE